MLRTSMSLPLSRLRVICLLTNSPIVSARGVINQSEAFISHRQCSQTVQTYIYGDSIGESAKPNPVIEESTRKNSSTPGFFSRLEP